MTEFERAVLDRLDALAEHFSAIAQSNAQLVALLAEGDGRFEVAGSSIEPGLRTMDDPI